MSGRTQGASSVAPSVELWSSSIPLTGKAIALAGDELERNPSSWETLGLLGKYNAFSGDTETARENTERMLALPNLPGLIGARFFQQALVFDPGVNAFGGVLSDAAQVDVGN